MTQILHDFKSFLENSPSSWHALEEIGNRLAIKGFIPLTEEEKWDLSLGKSYFVEREGSLCAFTLPKEKPRAATIIASHTDSPGLKLKPQPFFKKDNMLMLGAEIYGAPLLSSWMNRDLGIAGRVVIMNESRDVEERLVFIDDAPLTIPQLAIHLDREVNEKGLLLDKQEHLAAIASITDEMRENYLEKLLLLRLSFKTLLGFDLFLTPLESPHFMGPKGEMLSSYRLDNLTSVHATTVALQATKAPLKSTLQMGIFYDHEEIGSKSREGAASPFLTDVLQRICHLLKMDVEEYIRLKTKSLCVSCDVTHAYNPNYPKKYDENHKNFLGKGVVVKVNADQKYASNAHSVARIVSLAKALRLDLQHHASRSDISSGSTVGPIFSSMSGILTVDIGCALLSMHSIREMISCQDHLDLCKLLTSVLEEEV